MIWLTEQYKSLRDNQVVLFSSFSVSILMSLGAIPVYAVSLIFIMKFYKITIIFFLKYISCTLYALLIKISMYYSSMYLSSIVIWSSFQIISVKCFLIYQVNSQSLRKCLLLDCLLHFLHYYLLPSLYCVGTYYKMMYYKSIIQFCKCLINIDL